MGERSGAGRLTWVEPALTTERYRSPFEFHPSVIADSNAVLHDEIVDAAAEESSPSAEPVWFDVRLLVGDVVALLRPAAEHKRLFFKCTVAPGIPDLVLGDPSGLTEALTLLLDNAIELTESGWVRLVVSSAHNFGDQIGIRFEVHDSGICASRDQERRLSLADGRTSLTADGDPCSTGLELCRRLVATMGGVVDLCSVPGLGSALSFTLAFELPADGPAL